MTKRTIVAMRGQPRTYNYIKDHTRAILDQVYGDYKFIWVTRPSSTITHEQMLEDWQGHDAEIVYADTYDNPSRNSQRDQSYLDWELRQHIAWDTVEQMVLIRPDVYYVPQHDCLSVQNIKPMTITGWWIEDPVKESVSDFYCQAGAQAAQLLLSRHEAAWRELSEWMVQQQFDTEYHPCNNVLKDRGNYASWACRVVRPTQIPLIKPEWNGVSNYDPEWDRLQYDQRRAMCVAWNIDPRDYGLR